MHFCAVVHHDMVDMWCGSLTRPYDTSGLFLKIVASFCQKSAKAYRSTQAGASPTSCPSQVAPPSVCSSAAHCQGSMRTVIPRLVAWSTTFLKLAKYCAYPGIGSGTAPQSWDCMRSQENSNRSTRMFFEW